MIERKVEKLLISSDGKNGSRNNDSGKRVTLKLFTHNATEKKGYRDIREVWVWCLVTVLLTYKLYSSGLD